MKENTTELVFILDASGSMHGLEADTMGGFNSFIENQKKLDGEVKVTIAFFSKDIRIVHDGLPIEELAPLTARDYKTGGSTALLDAVGFMINLIGMKNAALPEENRPENVIFVITTDGEENASTHYSLAQIKTMVSEKQEKDSWEFLFLAANIDAFSAAEHMGISRQNSRQFNYSCDMAIGGFHETDEFIRTVRTRKKH